LAEQRTDARHCFPLVTIKAVPVDLPVWVATDHVDKRVIRMSDQQSAWQVQGNRHGTEWLSELAVADACQPEGVADDVRKSMTRKDHQRACIES